MGVKICPYCGKGFEVVQSHLNFSVTVSDDGEEMTVLPIGNEDLIKMPRNWNCPIVQWTEEVD